MSVVPATTAGNILKLYFNATAIANIADNAASSPITQIAWALHTADPSGGSQSTSEAAYTSYARVNVNRNSGGHTITSNSMSPAALVAFPAGTGGSGTATYFSTGKTGGGATDIFWTGAIAVPIVMGNTITPELSTATTCTLA